MKVPFIAAVLVYVTPKACIMRECKRISKIMEHSSKHKTIPYIHYTFIFAFFQQFHDVAFCIFLIVALQRAALKKSAKIRKYICIRLSASEHKCLSEKKIISYRAQLPYVFSQGHVIPSFHFIFFCPFFLFLQSYNYVIMQSCSFSFAICQSRLYNDFVNDVLNPL